MAIPRRFIGISAAVLILLLLGGGVYLRLSGKLGGGGTTAQAAAAPEDRPQVSATEAFGTEVAIPVEGTRVVQDTLVISVSSAAQAAAVRESKILAQVQGRVLRIHRRENDPVREGQVILEIDPTEYELQVERAQANLARAQASFREIILFDDQIADPEVRAERERVARAKSGLQEAEVQLREAELQLARTRVTAPFGGRVASIMVVTGQHARQGDELLTVVDLNPIRVEAQVLESEIALLAPGRRASISFSAFPGETFHGVVETINPLVDQQTRAARVTIRVPNPGGRILPGMYARVALEARKFADRILVPRTAVLERDRRTMLFVFDGDGSTGLAKWRYVTTGLANDSLVEIVDHPETEMVRPGEIVLSDGHYTLIHDARVRVVEDVRAAGGRPQ